MGMDWVAGARKGKLRAFTAEAPAVGILVASALPPQQHAGPLELASLPWCSCQLGQLQSGQTPAHTAIACFGLRQGIGQGRDRSPVPYWVLVPDCALEGFIQVPEPTPLD